MNANGTPDEYFAALSGPSAKIARQLRARLGQLAPNLQEHMAWGFPSYRGKERFLSLMVQPGGYVNVQLFNGAALAKQFPRIEGSGKHMRHVKVRSVSDIDDGLQAIIAAAIALDIRAPFAMP